MMSFSAWVKTLANEFVGKKVQYEGKIYTIVKVDSNGLIHIDKPSMYNTTTAVYEPCQARKNLV